MPHQAAPGFMQATEGALIAIVFGILLAHLALLRFLHRCKDLMPTTMDGVLSDGLHPITMTLTDLGLQHATVNEQLAEVCRIGADLADALEAMPTGVGAASVAPAAGMPDLQTTIMDLMLNRFLGSSDASPQEQIRPIHQGQATPNHDDPADYTEPTP
jgi:hypothetical protein